MKAVILGAGWVGRELARNLVEAGADVVLIDHDAAALDAVRSRFSAVRTVSGDGSKIRVLRDAGVEDCQIFLALTSNSPVNILACCLSKRLNVPQTVARVRGQGHFGDKPEMASQAFGVDAIVSSEAICATDVISVLRTAQLRETVPLSHPRAQITNVCLPARSPLLSRSLAEIAKAEVFDHVRLCAVLRHDRLLMPNGRTTFAPGDELCVVGGAEEIGRFVDWAAPGERPVANIVIAGATRLTLLLAEQLRELGLRVVMIEADAAKAERATDLLGGLVIHGAPTNVDVLREARVDRCDGFVSMQEKNEETIMACMLAKQQGALKTVALSNSPNHLQMITSMPSIDCGFSPRLAAINHVIRHLPENSDGIRTTLKRTPVEVREYTVVKRSPIANARICDATIPEGVIIGCIVRDGELLPAAGSEKLLRGDRACVISRPENAIKAANLFRCTEKKGA